MDAGSKILAGWLEGQLGSSSAWLLYDEIIDVRMNIYIKRLRFILFSIY